jgi:hypothetical protein
MTPAAKDAQLDFVRLAAEEPSSLYIEQFLRDGFAVWPTEYQRRYPSLATWSGVAGLKRSLRRLANVSSDWPVLLASRSLSLVKLAASCMFRVCSRVLATDLSWPTYQHVLDRRAARAGGTITSVPIREQVFARDLSARDVADIVTDHYVAQRCDGLFLPAVDHLGIRLPLREIMRRIEQRAELRFVFIDAAQAFCHVPLDSSVEIADFIVAGSHKWLGGYLPMGIAFVGRQCAAGVQRLVTLLQQTGNLDDPLLRFTQQLDGGMLDSHSETANLSSLFACAGAVADFARGGKVLLEGELPSIDEVERLVTVPRGDWRLLSPMELMRSRIALFESSACRDLPVDVLRQKWFDAGRIVSAYPHGRVRVSFPFAAC